MNKMTRNGMTPTPTRFLRWGLVLLLSVVLLAVLGGCAGGGAPKPLTEQQFSALGEEMARIEEVTPEERQELDGELVGTARTSEDPNVQGRALYLRGYAAEVAETRETEAADARDYSDALARYQESAAIASAYQPSAMYRMALLAEAGYAGTPQKSQELAKKTLVSLRAYYGLNIWMRNPDFAGADGTATIVTDAAALDSTSPALYSSALKNEDVATVAMRMLDGMYRTDTGLDGIYYKVVDAVVGTFKRISPAWGGVLALLFLAIIVKLVTLPMTVKGQRGMRDMQRIQPMLKELQEKYKDDKQKQAEEQMRIMREHKVSPLGGCLPMLIQIPVFIIVWQAVSVYAYQFNTDSFLWISSLAQPDMVLLGLYAVSIVVSQYLTATPSTDPQQKQMQMMMTWMMPIFLVFVLKSIASAFVLYWFFLNVFNSVHQYYLLQQFRKEDLAREAAAESSGQKKGKAR